MKAASRILAVMLLLAPAAVLALDPPHDVSNTINCINCHTPTAPPAAVLRAKRAIPIFA